MTPNTFVVTASASYLAASLPPSADSPAKEKTELLCATSLNVTKD